MSGCGRETLRDVQEWSGGLRGFVEMVVRRSRMPENGQKTLGEVRELSSDPSGCPGMVGKLSGICGSGRGPTRMSGSGRMPSRKSEIGQEALPDVMEWLGGPRGRPGVVGSLSGMYWCGREVLPDVQDWSKGLSGSPGVVVRPSRMSGSGPDTLRDDRE